MLSHIRFSSSVVIRSIFDRICGRPFSVLSRENESDLINTTTKYWVKDFVINHKLCPWAGKVWNDSSIKIMSIPRRIKESEDEDLYIANVIEAVCQEAFQLLDDEEVFKSPVVDIQHDPKRLHLRSLAEEEENVNNDSTIRKESKDFDNDRVVPFQNEFPNSKNRLYTTALIAVPEFKDFDDFLNIVDIVEDSLDAAELTDFIQVASFHPQYRFADSTSEAVENYTNRSPFPLIHLLRVNDVAEAIHQYTSSVTQSSSKRNASKKSGRSGSSRHSKEELALNETAIVGKMDEIWINNGRRMNRMGKDKLKAEFVTIVRKAVADCQQRRSQSKTSIGAAAVEQQPVELNPML